MATLSTAEFFGALALLVVAAHLGGFAATRARLPSVVGELAAGVALAVIPSAFIRGLRNDALIGVDLGPNLAITGSLATILWLIALRREEVNVSFWEFFKVGIVVMPISLAAATLGSLAANALG